MKVERIGISSETSQLKSVFVGTAFDRSPIIYKTNSRIRYFSEVLNSPPNHKSQLQEIDRFADLLSNKGVQVLRPENVPGTTQIFVRDIAFVIGGKLIISRMREPSRQGEIEGIRSLIDQLQSEQVLTPPEDALVEGGDIVRYGNYLFVGKGNRTNDAGIAFLRESFPQLEIVPVSLSLSKNEPLRDTLHLDCALQPVGRNMALFFGGGILDSHEAILDIFGGENLIQVTREEAFELTTNVFSISPETVVSEERFLRINSELRQRGLEVLPIPYFETSKEGGLFRCSTLPLWREG